MNISLFILVTLLIAGDVLGHSERFHVQPLNGGRPSKKHREDAESHLANVRAITNSGINAEAYWNFQGTQLSFQAIRGHLAETHPCDQIYIMNIDGSDIQVVSTGEGRDTCSYFTPDGNHVIYSSTQGGGIYCPPEPDMMYGYLWPIYSDMDIYKVRLSDMSLEQLTNNEGYNAESTISPDGTRIVFTSDRSGDLELYSMNLDGTEIQRLTYTPGYDGGAYYSYDNSMITWRANRPAGSNLTDYLNLLNLGLVMPVNMQIYVASADGSGLRPITSNDGTNFAPFFLPDDSGVIFSSNMDDPTSGEFHLYAIKLDGTGLTRITYEGTFNAFPMFSPDGKTLAWESNRNATAYTDINVFLAEWVW